MHNNNMHYNTLFVNANSPLIIPLIRPVLPSIFIFAKDICVSKTAVCNRS
uniref:Uncharacterized protein n=1 Tax=Anguilla anguilla TaxID=7936 RepID=A0A0E9QA10_ANGAN